MWKGGPVRLLFVLTGSLLLLLCPGAPSRADRSTVKTPSRARIDAYVAEQMERRHIAGLSIAVVRDGHVALAKGYGFANLELRVRATPTTVYELASITKQFTATAMMMLVGEGKVGLDVRASQYLPDLPAAWSGVTVRQLLTHSSGIKSYTSLPDLPKLSRKDFTHEEVIRLVADAPFDFNPGEGWSYNNTGYFLLGMLIEKVSGKPYGEFLQDRIFGPLGMASTRVNDFREIIPNRATGYSHEGGRLRNAEYLSPTQPYSAGALVSTVEDLARWDAALRSGKLLPSETLEQMWTPVKLNSGERRPYGFGWQVGERKGHRYVWHGGGISGFSTNITRLRDGPLSVIVLSNTQGGGADAIAMGILALVVPELAEERPRPIKDEDPALTARLRRVFLGLVEGAADPHDFTEQARGFLFPDRVKEARELFQGAGPLRAFELLERRPQGEIVSSRYRATFARQAFQITFGVTKDQKLAGIGIRPD
jgi:D-alanyl-D-alanine carboxypeptidase